MKWARKPVNILISILVLTVLWVITGIIILPNPLFTDSYSTVVFDRNEQLLGAKLADDAQWRFSYEDSIPEKFKLSILSYEDRHFYYHPGINLISIVNAFIDNIKAGKVVRGGSTISMQVIRLARKGRSRTLKEKFIESLMAIGLEIIYTKDEILNFYCSHAPFGGNIVGLGAASWRYFGRPNYDLSWAEAATLAVLPNSPSLIHPGRNRDKLKLKRNALLKRLYKLEHIDSLQYQLALLEEIPEKTKPLPYIAPHLTELFSRSNNGELVSSTIDQYIQEMVNSIIRQHSNALNNNGINNASILVVNSKNKEVLAYVGNIQSDGQLKVKNKYNDMVMAKRSTGSILKPFLYAAMLDDGIILPNSLIRDIPSYFANYHPVNYNNKFQGSVPASQALSKSLNVPAVYMLQEYGIGRFLHFLEKTGFKTFNKSPDHYGLSLILGGGEASLFELVNAYTGMANTLFSYDENYGRYPVNSYDKLILNLKDTTVKDNSENIPLKASSIWLTYEALKKVSRPETETGWENFVSSQNIAWKTGTSHGFKDAWAIGTTADYVIGVWVGNADGEGRNGLTGTKTAAPIMFDIFNNLNLQSKFYPPYDELTEVEVCTQSGNLASINCPEKENILVGLNTATVKHCTYHKLIFTDMVEEFRLSQQCADISELKPVKWFVLPPVQEHYFMMKHPSYKSLPPFAPGCGQDMENDKMEFIYPVDNSMIYVAVDENKKQKEIVFEISHHYPETNIYWHLDKQLIGITRNNHQLPFIPDVGTHILTVVDGEGTSLSVIFEVLK